MSSDKLKIPKNDAGYGEGYPRHSCQTADRIAQHAHLGVLNREKIKRIASETLDIYAPIAMRLG